MSMGGNVGGWSVGGTWKYFKELLENLCSSHCVHKHWLRLIKDPWVCNKGTWHRD